MLRLGFCFHGKNPTQVVPLSHLRALSVALPFWGLFNKGVLKFLKIFKNNSLPQVFFLLICFCVIMF